MKIRKKIIKSAAKIYAANLIINAMGSGAESILMNEDERSYMAEELEKIADKIMPGINAPTLDDCLSEAIRRS